MSVDIPAEEAMSAGSLFGEGTKDEGLENMNREGAYEEQGEYEEDAVDLPASSEERDELDDDDPEQESLEAQVEVFREELVGLLEKLDRFSLRLKTRRQE